MKKTTIMLPPELHRRAIRKAAALGISLAERVRQLLDSDTRTKTDEEPDPILKAHLFKGEPPARPMKEYDDVLYGDPHT